MDTFRKRRPQVLLLGNGVIRAYSDKALSWQDLLKRIGTREVPDNLGIPMPLEIVLRTEDHVDMVLDHHYRELYGVVDTKDFGDTLRSIFDIGFDHILTTNYSYELEEAALGVPMFTDEELKQLIRHSTEVKDEEQEFMLFTCNEVSVNGKSCRIWHIHGEARKPNSIVLGHLYYGNLLTRCSGYLYGDAGCEEGEVFSWVDAFMLGDVYTLGFGYDFSEMDLWWLLDYKKIFFRNEGGKLYYYRPGKLETFDVKSTLLQDYGAQIINFGEQEPVSHVNEYYKGFYKKSLEDIRRRVVSANASSDSPAAY